MHDELIKWLRVFCEDCKQWDGCKCCLKGECSQQKILQAADAIELLVLQLAFRDETAKLVAQKLPKWIPVTERLPEHSGDYLVYSVGGNWKQLSTIEIAFWNDKNFIVQNFFAVTHWMPLPEPPESEETKWS